MDVAPGEQVIFTFADFAGINETDLIRNAKLFQSLYNNNCATPKPPDSETPGPARRASAAAGGAQRAAGGEQTNPFAASVGTMAFRMAQRRSSDTAAATTGTAAAAGTQEAADQP